MIDSAARLTNFSQSRIGLEKCADYNDDDGKDDHDTESDKHRPKTACVVPIHDFHSVHAFLQVFGFNFCIAFGRNKLASKVKLPEPPEPVKRLGTDDEPKPIHIDLPPRPSFDMSEETSEPGR